MKISVVITEKNEVKGFTFQVNIKGRFRVSLFQ